MRKPPIIAFFLLGFLSVANFSCTDDKDEKDSKAEKIPENLDPNVYPHKDPVVIFDLDESYETGPEPRVLWIKGAANLADDSTVLVEITGKPGEINSKTRIGTSALAFIKKFKFEFPLRLSNFMKFPTGTYQIRAWVAPSGAQNPNTKIPKGKNFEIFKAKKMVKIANPDLNQEKIKLAKTALDIQLKTEKKELVKTFSHFLWTLDAIRKVKGPAKSAKANLAKQMATAKKLSDKYYKKRAKLKTGNLRLTYSRVVSLYKKIDSYKNLKISTLAGISNDTEMLKKTRKQLDTEIRFRIETVKNDSFY